MLATLAPAARAQISPGPLAAPHAKLEGSTNCLLCHEASKGVAPQRCLTCHKPLAKRIAAGEGLHARAAYRDCRSCHVEHHGRDYQLIWWGKKGTAGFDHGLTGFVLAGAHVRLACRKCHQASLVRDPSLVAAGKDLARTYLGLDPACASCHRDPHQGEFSGKGCNSCHGQASWKPASEFHHRDTRYPLTGLHQKVSCEKCHRTGGAPEGAEKTISFKGVAFAQCSECHRDPHTGRLGTSCSSCHSTAGWKQIKNVRFDHDRTRYPLRGKHRVVKCAACHGSSGHFRRPRFGRCADCHRDPHHGVFAARADHGRCESCHDVDGFRPASYGVAEHQKSRYPLEGAHLAVPCDGCHGARTQRRERGRSRMRPLALSRFRFDSFACRTCHRDPHGGKLDRYMGKKGCVACHSVAAWSKVLFDHGATAFPLDGKHRAVSCEKCHSRVERGSEGLRMKLSGLGTHCADCHRDPHEVQFVRAGVPLSCDSCHVTSSWKPLRFDHNRDTRYALDGAHRKVPCAGCHPRVRRNGKVFVHYRPLPTTCTGCHGSGQKPGSDGGD